MSHISDVVGQYRAEIEPFVEVAERYCALIERWQADPEAFELREFLVILERLLPEVYMRAVDLPDPWEWYEDDEEEEVEAEEGGDQPRVSSKVMTEEEWEAEDKARREEQLRKFPRLADYSFPSMSLMRALGAAFGKLNYRREVFNPYSEVLGAPEDGEVLHRGLDDDVSSVYDWLKAGLVILSHNTDDAIQKALWDLRFNFDIHAAIHLAGALRALSHLRDRIAIMDDQEENDFFRSLSGLGSS